MNQVDAAWRERLYCEAKAGKKPKKLLVNLPNAPPNYSPKWRSNYEASFPPSPGSCDHCGSPAAKGRSQSARRLPRTANDYYADVIRLPESPDYYMDSPRAWRSPKSDYSDSSQVSHGARTTLRQLRDEVNIVKKQLELERMERDRLQSKVASLERESTTPASGHRPRARTARGGRDMWGRDPAYKARDGTDTIRDQTSPWKEQLRHKKPDFLYN